MHQRISKKILIYLFVFFLVGSLNNKKIMQFIIPTINNFEIFGLTELENNQVYQELNTLRNLNIFFLKKDKILEIINSNKVIEKFSIFKNYPSNLIINIKKTKFLAHIKKNNLDFYIGSNGNLIEAKDNQIDLPFIFGNIEIEEFLKLKRIIDNSGFNYDDIKNLYYFKSKRWDIETKNNLVIKLPIKKLKASFEILLKIYEAEEFIDFKIIDLRQDNQVILNG
jgi:cell division protein FtsQ